MTLYLFTLCGVFLISTIATNFEKNSLKSKIWIFILVVFLILISGLRVDSTLYSDEWNYRHMFNSYIGVPLSSIHWSLLKEPAFKFLMWFLANIGLEAQSLVLVAAIFTISVYVWFIYKNSHDFQLALYIFIAGGTFFTTMNILRQYIAISIILMGFHNIEKKKKWRFLVYVFIASLFHVSAWIAIGYYFFLNIEKIEKKLLPLGIVLFILIGNFSKIIQILESTEYGDYSVSYATNGYGVSWMRLIFWGAIAIFILLEKTNIFQNEEFSKNIVNGYFLSTFLLIASKVYVYIFRLDYTGICTCIMISQTPKAFTEKSRKLAKLLIMFVFFLYGYYQVVVIGAYSNMRNLLFTFI